MFFRHERTDGASRYAFPAGFAHRFHNGLVAERSDFRAVSTGQVIEGVYTLYLIARPHTDTAEYAFVVVELEEGIGQIDRQDRFPVPHTAKFFSFDSDKCCDMLEIARIGR